MKLFLGTDLHGGPLGEVCNNADLILIVGDFSKGDKLREAIFKKGNVEEAEKEVTQSAENFLKTIPTGTILSPGNAEKICIKDVSNLAKKYGHIFLRNEIVDVKGVKIMGLSFFMEEGWAEVAYPGDFKKIERAKKEELETKKFLEKNPKVDIVLSHLPPYGILDTDSNPPKFLQKNRPKNCGSKLLLNYILKNQPKLAVCGHIQISGEVIVGKTKVINPGKGRLITFS